MLLPAIAHAGSYEVYSCQQDPNGGTGGWSATSFDTEVVGTSDGGCQAGGTGLDVFTESTSPFEPNIGSANYWQFQAPAGTTIGTVSLWMQGQAATGWFLPITDTVTGGSLATAASATWGNSIAEGTSSSCEDAGGTANQQYPGCNSGGPNQASPTNTPAFSNVQLPGGPNSAIDIGVECAQGAPGNTSPWADCAATTGEANLSNTSTVGGAAQYLYGSRIQILDNQTPNITAVTIPSQAWVSGTQTISDTDLYTSDPVGVASEAVTLQAASGSDFSQTWKNPNCSDDNAEALVVSNVTYYVPCSDPGSGLFSVNTANMPNGCYSTTVSLTDPAGNTSSKAGGQMCVSNSAPGPIQDVSTSSSTWTNATAGTIGWADPTNDPAPVGNVLYTVNGGSVTTAAAGTTLTLSRLPEGADSVCIWLKDVAGNSSASNKTCETLKVDYKTPSFGALSYTPRSGRIKIAASALSGLNPNTLSFSASDTSGTVATVNGYIQGGHIIAQFPRVDSNRETWTLKVNVSTNAGTAVTKSFVFYPTNAYHGPKPITVSHYSVALKGKHKRRITFLKFTPRKAAGSDNALHISVNGKTVKSAKAGQSAVIQMPSGNYTLGVEVNYKGGEIIESTSKYTGSHGKAFTWKIA
jgi:hypothetical protein